MSRFRCYTCRRPSDTEAEHLGHRCSPARSWLVYRWRKFKALFGLWSWGPPDDWNRRATPGEPGEPR